MKDFKNYGFSQEIMAVLERIKFFKPTKIQEEVIPK